MENFELVNQGQADLIAANKIHGIGENYYPTAMRNAVYGTVRKWPSAPERIAQLQEVALILGDY